MKTILFFLTAFCLTLLVGANENLPDINKDHFTVDVIVNSHDTAKVQIIEVEKVAIEKRYDPFINSINEFLSGNISFDYNYLLYNTLDQKFAYRWGNSYVIGDRK